MNYLSSLIFILIFGLGSTLSFQKLHTLNQSGSSSGQEEEVLYLPKGPALKALAFGADNVLSNILWFQTINYFGKHYKSDRDYQWLAHMCGLVVDLDPKARHVYDFCSMMLAWEAKDPEASIKFLDRGIAAEPDYWRYYYLRGMNKAIFLKAGTAAESDFVKASKAPEAPIFLARLATKTMAILGDPGSAVGFLKNLIAQSKDENEKAALTEHMQKTMLEIDLNTLQETMESAKANSGRYPDTLAAVVPNIAEKKDPFGGSYYWDAESSQVKSTSGKERIKIFSEAVKQKISNE